MKLYILVTMYQLTHREDTIEFYKSRELACKARDLKLENFKEKLCIVTNIYEFELMSVESELMSIESELKRIFEKSRVIEDKINEFIIEQAEIINKLLNLRIQVNPMIEEIPDNEKIEKNERTKQRSELNDLRILWIMRLLIRLCNIRYGLHDENLEIREKASKDAQKIIKHFKELGFLSEENNGNLTHSELKRIFEKSRVTEDKINKFIIEQEEIISKLLDLSIQVNPMTEEIPDNEKIEKNERTKQRSELNDLRILLCNIRYGLYDENLEIREKASKDAQKIIKHFKELGFLSEENNGNLTNLVANEFLLSGEKSEENNGNLTNLVANEFLLSGEKGDNHD